MANITYIAVAGNMGCGKSTLVDFICKNYKAEPFFERNALNPYLGDFYKDMKVWAFHSQLFYLTQKFRIHQELDLKRGERTVVLDRSIYEDAEIFAKNLRNRKFINKHDWNIYQHLYETILNAIQPPDLMIYLRASVRTIRKRIALRGRPEENNIPLPYLRSLNTLYEKWIKNYRRSPVLVLETDNLNYLDDMIHRLDVQKTMEKYLTPY